MIETVAIVGTGLIGASFGLALKAAGFDGRILGVSSPPPSRTRSSAAPSTKRSPSFRPSPAPT